MEHEYTGELLSLKEALNNILTLTTPIAEKEIISLTESINRITATEIISPINVPPFDNSAMDGYAIRFNDWHDATPLVIAGKALAGSPFRGSLPAKTCIRIMTGAPIPTGVDTVIMQENTRLADNAISFIQPIKPGINIRYAGEDIRQGDTVLPVGTKLSATQISLIASLGISQIEVFRQLKVAIFSTGDELQTIGQPLAAGQIYDTNRLAIRLMLEKMNCHVIDLGIIADDPDKLYQAFKQADQQADLVISSGGVSVGEADYTKQILNQIGSINFWQLAIKPGKPFAFGKLKSAWFCGLPGNAVSAIVTFYQLVQPFINHLCAFSQWQSTPYLKARATSPIKTSPGRLEFQRGIAKVNSQGDLEVIPMTQQGSHILSSFNQSNCFIVLAQNRGMVNLGELVDIEYFNHLLISE
jgi:molybdopterin molybdotransferase